MPMKKAASKKYVKKYNKRIPRPIRRVYPKKYHGVKYFTETIQNLMTIESPNPATENDYNLALSFSQLSNATTYQALFEQFAIIGIKFIYRPNYNVQTAGVTPIGIPRMFFTEDKSSTGTQTITQLQQDDHCKVLMSNKQFSHYIRMPQPCLTQGNGTLGGSLLVQQSNKDLYWLRTGDEAARQLLYLSALISVAGNNNSTFATGSISAKVYLAFREQS